MAVTGDVSMNTTISEAPTKRLPNTILKRAAVSASTLTGPTPAKQRREDPRTKLQPAAVSVSGVGHNRLASVQGVALTSVPPALRLSRSTTTLQTASSSLASNVGSTLNLTVTKTKPSVTTLSSVGQGQGRRALLMDTAGPVGSNRAQHISESRADGTLLRRNSPTVPGVIKSSGRKAKVVADANASMNNVVADSTTNDGTSNSPSMSYGGFMFAVREPPSTSRVEDTFVIATSENGHQQPLRRSSAETVGGDGVDLNSTFTMVDGIYPLPEEMDAVSEAVERDRSTVPLSADQRHSLDLFGTSSAALDVTVNVKTQTAGENNFISLCIYFVSNII